MTAASTTTIKPYRATLFSSVLRLLALLLVGGVAVNLNLALGISDRVVFILLVVIGMTLCGRGPLGFGHVYGWTNILHLAGYVVGAAALALALIVIFRIPAAWIASERTAIYMLAGMMLVKVAISFLYPRRAA